MKPSRPDAELIREKQAKSLGEYLRAKWVPIPVPLLDARSRKGPSVASVQPDFQ